MADFFGPAGITVRCADGMLYWKCAWDGTNSAGGLAYWPTELRIAFTKHVVIVDKIIILGTTAANENYYFVFYDNFTSAKGGAIYGPSGNTTAATAFQNEHEGPYGPIITDQTTNSIAFHLFAKDGAFTAGDDFIVDLCGRAIPIWTDPISVTQPVAVKDIEVWPWNRTR